MDSRPRQFAEGEEKDEPIVVIVIGGDGTTHELIEGVTVDYQAGNEEQGWGRWELIVLPFGTVGFGSLHCHMGARLNSTFRTPL